MKGRAEKKKMVIFVHSPDEGDLGPVEKKKWKTPSVASVLSLI